MANSRCLGSHVLPCIILASPSAAVYAQEIIGTWTVEYRTKALKVEAVKESSTQVDKRLVIVEVKNTSGRPITAVSAEGLKPQEAASIQLGAAIL